MDDADSSLGATPAYPSPAITTPFFKRGPVATGNESYNVSGFGRSRAATPHERLLDDDDDADSDDLPPTPECAELPQSVKMLRHCSRFEQSSSSTPEHFSADMDDSLGPTPRMSSPPVSVALLQSEASDTTPVAQSTPVNRICAAAAVVPDSAFDPKYQRGFEQDVLQMQRRDAESDEEDQVVRPPSMAQEESWLVGEAEQAAAEDLEAVRAAELQKLRIAQEHAQAVFEEARKQKRIESEERKNKAEMQQRAREEQRLHDEKQAAERKKAAEEMAQKASERKKQLESEKRAIEEAEAAKRRAAEAVSKAQAAQAAAEKEESTRIAQEESKRRAAEAAKQETIAVAISAPVIAEIAPMAAPVEAVAPVVAAVARWTPKPEEVRDFSRPPPVASKPVFVARPAAPAPKPVVARVAPLAPAVRQMVCVVTMDVESESVHVERAVAPPAPAVRAAAPRAEQKARLKVVYGVFARRAGALTLDEVVLELNSAEWPAEEAEKTLNMLVVLKLLQKTGDTWAMKQ